MADATNYSGAVQFHENGSSSTALALAALCFAAFAISLFASAGQPDLIWFLILALGVGNIAYAIFRMIVSGRVLFTLSPSGIDINTAAVQNMNIPWDEVIAVEIVDVVLPVASRSLFVPSEQLFEKCTSIEISFDFLKTISPDLAALRKPGPVRDCTVYFDSDRVLVLLRPQIIGEKPARIYLETLERWRAFSDRANRSAATLGLLQAGVRPVLGTGRLTRTGYKKQFNFKLGIAILAAVLFVAFLVLIDHRNSADGLALEPADNATQNPVKDNVADKKSVKDITREIDAIFSKRPN